MPTEMKTFSQELDAHLCSLSLLDHPLYRAWSDGSLPRETLQLYARQYFRHVDAFPRYLSATHAGCPDASARRLLLANLLDEEGMQGSNPVPHPELWLRFAEGLGEERSRVLSEAPMPETRALVDCFFEAARSSWEEGLGALYAYERQIPGIAKFKLEALQRHFGVEDARSLSFFEVHREADVWHSEAIAELLDRLPEESRMKVEAAARRAAEALWRFLDGIQRESGCHAA